MPSASTVSTTPFAGQKPGTSGLRKKVSEFLGTPNYVENFLQCTLEAVGDDLKGATLVVGGDGRYGVRETVAKIVQMAAANGVSVGDRWWSGANPTTNGGMQNGSLVGILYVHIAHTFCTFSTDL